MPLPSLFAVAALPAIRLAMGTTTSVPNDTLTALSFDTILRRDWWDAPSLPLTTLTMPFTGKVLVSVYDLDWTPIPAVNNITGYRALSLIWNGAGNRIAATPANPAAASGNSTVHSGAHEFEVVAGDTLGLSLRQNSGATLGPAVLQWLVEYKRRGN